MMHVLDINNSILVFNVDTFSHVKVFLRLFLFLMSFYLLCLLPDFISVNPGAIYCLEVLMRMVISTSSPSLACFGL